MFKTKNTQKPEILKWTKHGPVIHTEPRIRLTGGSWGSGLGCIQPPRLNTVHEDMIYVWYYGTRKSDLFKAKWFVIYQKPNSKLTSVQPAGTADHHYKGEVDYDPDILDDPSQILIKIDVKLDNRQRLDPRVIRELHTDNFQHHRVGIIYGAYSQK